MSKFPNPDTQFKPGYSGNPAGYSRRRRIADAVINLVDADPSRSKELGLIVWMMATGQPDKLQGRTPDLGWFKELRSILGEDRQADDPEEDDGETVDPEVAARMLRGANDVPPTSDNDAT